MKHADAAMYAATAPDDFGTGYSSLAYLRRLPIDVLKIDRSFVMNADRDEGDAQVVKLIVALGRALKLEIVAEGVETESQAEFLRSCDCDIAHATTTRARRSTSAPPAMSMVWSGMHPTSPTRPRRRGCAKSVTHGAERLPDDPAAMFAVLLAMPQGGLPRTTRRRHRLARAGRLGLPCRRRRRATVGCEARYRVRTT
jgi:hypothetical protein